MAIFSRSSDSSERNADYLTRNEAAPYAAELRALSDRVTALEALARRLGYGRSGETRPVDTAGTAEAEGMTLADEPTYDRSGIPAAAQGESVPSGRTATPRTTTGVDYGAVAFGLSEIARKVRGAVGASQQMVDEYRGAVQYFADVFAKSDPAFDATEFKRQAGV